MKIKRKLLFLASLTLLLFTARKNAAADAFEEVAAGYIYITPDVRNVEFLSLGHLRKNKPRYREYKWKVIETPHFWLYVYDLDSNQEKFYIHRAEKKYEEFSAETGMRHFSKKIRIAIFNSARDFEESNLVTGMAPKGLGGQTEMIKWKRVLIAFRDSPLGFERLLAHELWHRYQGEFLKLTLMNFWKRDVPLWFVEGSAEHFAHKWDARGELFMRDAYLHKNLASVTNPYSWNSVGSIYKQGEFVIHFLAEEYKEKGEVISAILKASAKMKFSDAFEQVTGDTLEDFDKKLKKRIEKEYSPLSVKEDLADQLKPNGDGTILAARDNFFLTKKVVRGRERLILNWTNGKETKSKKLAEDGWLKTVNLKGHSLELSPEFGYQTQGGSFLSSTAAVYAADIGGKDALVIQEFSFDPKKKKVGLEKKEIYPIKELREAQYPIAINNEEIALVGREGIFAELYLFNRKNGSLKKLTSARRTYRGLSYSKKLNGLVTSVENDETNSYDLALYDLNAGALKLLTQTPENEFSAVCSADGGRMLYVSDRGLAHNLYLYDLEKTASTKLTDAKIGFFHPHWFSEQGIIFNSYQQSVLKILTAPLPKKQLTTVEQKSAPKKTEKNTEEDIKEWKKLLPGSDSMTIFEIAVSSGRQKALLLENRNLSMVILKRKEPEIKFYLVDKSTTAVIQFTLKEFRKMAEVGNAEMLAGTNVLIQNTKISVEKTRKSGSSDTEEITYKESYIYDWQEQKIYKADAEFSSSLLGRSRFLVKFSPKRDYLFWVEGSRKKIVLYDILKKEKRVLEKKFYEIQDVVFVSNEEILVLDKKWNLNLAKIHLLSQKTQTWEKLLPENPAGWGELEWFPLSGGTKIFFLVPQKKGNKLLNVFLFDTATSSLSIVQAGLPPLEKSELKENQLRLTLKNDFGLRRTLLVDELGNVAMEDEKLGYAVNFSSFTGNPSLTPLGRRNEKFYREIPTRARELYKLPRIIHAYGAAAISAGTSGIGTFVALETLAFDELNNKAVVGTIYLQNGNQGLADIRYYNFDKGRSYLLNYWNVSNYWHKLDVGFSKNIFLHEYLNWDLTLKQQQIRNERENVTADWLRTKAATSFSIDTAVWDCEANNWRCHGPYSGTALFTELETGVDYKLGYQATDLNLDSRYYFPLTDRSGLAMRLAAGKSFGPYPSIYIWGGNKTFRGVPLFSQAGNAYVLQSADLRFPIMDYLGAVFSGPMGEVFAPLTMQVDIRGGLYSDIGDIWYAKEPLFDGHQGFKLQQSAGYFINIPTAFGLNVRFSKGLYGKQRWNFWLGYNW